MNAREPSPSAQFSVFLSRFPAGIVALVKRSLPKLRRALPGAYELVYDYSNSVVVAFGMSERGIEALVAVAISAREVRLYFDKSLPDPKGLLGGSGTKVRSVVLEAASELDRGDIRDLVQAAIRHAGVTFRGTGKTRLVIKSGSKQRKAPKARKSPA